MLFNFSDVTNQFSPEQKKIIRLILESKCMGAIFEKRNKEMLTKGKTLNIWTKMYKIWKIGKFDNHILFNERKLKSVFAKIFSIFTVEFSGVYSEPTTFTPSRLTCYPLIEVI